MEPFAICICAMPWIFLYANDIFFLRIVDNNKHSMLTHYRFDIIFYSKPKSLHPSSDVLFFMFNLIVISLAFYTFHLFFVLFFSILYVLYALCSVYFDSHFNCFLFFFLSLTYEIKFVGWFSTRKAFKTITFYCESIGCATTETTVRDCPKTNAWKFKTGKYVLFTIFSYISYWITKNAFGTFYANRKILLFSMNNKKSFNVFHVQAMINSLICAYWKSSSVFG